MGMEEDKERSQYQRDRAEQFDDDVQRWTGGILEGVADGIADDARLVSEGFLGKHVALIILEEARLDVLLGVVPGAAAVIHYQRHQDAADSTNHQEGCGGLWAKRQPTTMGLATTRTPGRIICRSAALVLMSTQLA